MVSSSSQFVLNLPANQALKGLQDAAMCLARFEEERTNAVKAEAMYAVAKDERDSIIKEIKDVEKKYENKGWQEKYNALQASAIRLGPSVEAAERKVSASEMQYKEMRKVALDAKFLCEDHGISIKWDPDHPSNPAVVTNVSFAPMAK